MYNRTSWKNGLHWTALLPHLPVAPWFQQTSVRSCAQLRLLFPGSPVTSYNPCHLLALEHLTLLRPFPPLACMASLWSRFFLRIMFHRFSVFFLSVKPLFLGLFPLFTMYCHPRWSYPPLWLLSTVYYWELQNPFLDPWSFSLPPGRVSSRLLESTLTSKQSSSPSSSPHYPLSHPCAKLLSLPPFHFLLSPMLSLPPAPSFAPAPSYHLAWLIPACPLSHSVGLGPT